MAIGLEAYLLYDYTFWLRQRCTCLRKLYLAIKRNRAKDKTDAIARLKSIPPIYNIISLDELRDEFKALCSLLSQQPNFEDCLDIIEKPAHDLDLLIWGLSEKVHKDSTLKSLDYAASNFLSKQLRLLKHEGNVLNGIKLYEFGRILKNMKLNEILSPLLKQTPDIEIIEEPKTSNPKWPWTGTPGEYGAWIDILIEYGYIAEIPYKNQKARIAINTFNIKTQEGKPAKESYIIECFGQDKHHFNPNEIKIPFSKNYGKEE